MFRRLNTEKQFIKGASQHFYEVPDMLLRDAPSSGLNIRYYLTSHIRTGNLELGGEIFLRQPPTQAQFDQMLADVIGL